MKEKNKALETMVLPGLTMRKARTEQSIAVEEVAETLGLTERTLKALEADDYNKLPAPVYIRGYIRRYCSLLNIDPSATLEAFELHVDNDKQQSAEQEEKSILENRQLRIAIIGGISLLLLLLALAAFAETSNSQGQLDRPLSYRNPLALQSTIS